MPTLSQSLLKEYRQKTFRLAPGTSLVSPDQAIQYVNERGFIFFWPVTNVLLPSLWTAVAGDRIVADRHDDPGHITWSWKDTLLDKRVWYYARILRRKNTLVSLQTIPYFYALSPNYGQPEEDFYDQYEQGLLPLETKLIFEALINKGPLDTLSLRKEAHLTSATSQSPFARALDLLQQQLKVLPVAVSEAGAWNYAFVYDLTHRYYPELPELARSISEIEAMDQLTYKYLLSVGSSNSKQVSSLFHWLPELVERSLNRLIQSSTITTAFTDPESKFPVFCLPELINE